MALANLIEEQISCSVCFEIYTDPYLLRECLHTFCLHCIEQLEHNGRIDCPECRKVNRKADITKDFKTQGFIDAYLKQQPTNQTCEEEGYLGSNCGMCEMPNKPITSHCDECEHYMCSSCQDIHSRMKLTRNHRPKSVDQIFKSLKSGLTKRLSELAAKQLSVARNIATVEKSMQDIEASRREQIKKVNKITQEGLDALMKNQQRLVKEINEMNDTALGCMQSTKDIFEHSEMDFKKKIDYLNGLITTNDITTLIEARNAINKSFDGEIKKIESNFKDLDIEVNSPVLVRKEKELDVQNYISVKLATDTSCKVVYSDMLHHTYELAKSVDVHTSPYKFAFVKDELWCPTLYGIKVYNSNCELLRDIYHYKLKGAFSVAYSPTGHVFVVCTSSGLHILNTRGDYMCLLTSGSFEHVHFDKHKDQFYALTEKQVYVFEYRNVKWKQVQVLTVESKASSLDCICSHNDDLYISLRNEKCINIHSPTGESNHKRVTSGEPLLCDVDNVGNMLICNMSNNKIQICDINGTFHDLKLPVDVTQALYAVLDKDNNLWISLCRNRKLLKFARLK